MTLRAPGASPPQLMAAVLSGITGISVMETQPMEGSDPGWPVMVVSAIFITFEL